MKTTAKYAPCHSWILLRAFNIAKSVDFVLCVSNTTNQQMLLPNLFRKRKGKEEKKKKKKKPFGQIEYRRYKYQRKTRGLRAKASGPISMN
jgi:hypothetical protein